MPGIAGIIGGGANGANNAALASMVKCMMHEPGYSSGTYVNEGIQLWVGWTCHKGSFSDCTPIWNETKDVCIFFAGENFADGSGSGHSNVGEGRIDQKRGSYLVQLYEKQGSEFIDGLNGWYSGILADLRNGKVILFNDRYGIQRLYLHETENRFYFASEAKSLLKVLPGLRRLDLTGLAEFCSCGCALQNRTLFSGVSLLPGGSRWTFSRGQPPRKEFYHRKETWENQSPLGGEDFYRKLKETFTRILPRYFRNGQRLGMSLTGGLDSRMIMAWADCPPGTLPCYTFGGSYRDCTDVAVARKVAEACRQPHRIIPVDGEFLSRFPSLAEKAVYISDGSMDVTGSVELYVNSIAKAVAPIRLTGNYGSEILRGSVAFKHRGMDQALYNPEFVRLGQAAGATYADEVRGNRLSFVAFKQIPWYHHSRLAVEQSQLTLRSPYLDNDLVALAFQAPPDLASSNDPWLRLAAEGNPALSNIPTDRGLVYRPTPLVTKARRAYEQLTVRAEYAYDSGMPQWLARIDHLLAPLHPERMVLGRHKFYHFRVWYRDRLADYVKEILLDPRTRSRPYLCGDSLEKLVNAHVDGTRNHTRELHQLLTLELIQKHLLEQN